MILKENSTTQKLRGGYYTPKLLADFIVKNIKKKGSDAILEPSFGDGVFLDSILELIPSNKIGVVDAVEIDKGEYEKVSNRNYGSNYNIINDDFLQFYHNNNNKKYDLIVGNPPYIRYQYLTKEQREIQSEILVNNGMKANKLINSWVCFLVACIQMLTENGSIGFIIPAELLQVVYAKDLRQYVSNHLSKITLITFKKLVFPEIEQEVVVLIGEKNSNISIENSEISVVEYNDLEDMYCSKLENIEYQKIGHTKEKWTKYFLTSSENELINAIRNNNKFSTFDDISIVNVGITTGNNKFFSVEDEIVKKYKLDDIVIPLIGRSAHAHGLYFIDEDWKKNIDTGKKAQLIIFPEDVSYNDYPDSHKEYIKLGESTGQNKGYKCQIRDRWYIVPSVWIPDAFFLRRNNRFPKFVLNKINAVSTDTMHRIKFKKHIDRNKALLSYYNSISLAFTEINGRSYGGGVLEILPREVGNILLPNIQKMDTNIVNDLLKQIDDNLRSTDDIESILDITDKIVLHDFIGIDNDTIEEFRVIWKKLMNRRLSRNS